MNTGEKIAQILQNQLDSGCSIVELSNFAFQLTQDESREISDEIYEALFDLILLQEGPEFEMDDSQIRDLIKKMATMP